ncbi:L-aspartate oxidase [Methylorubrum populi BJ001]|jgi:L-aspartate oxidase|uniref:L-aspartate oxidase n=1 Tax=Methylorubrum populi (strain ATCC BAA-705 / NCIMB 13946 / BJ001) TaxID=441620 RepID=B1ZD58_METPB|nr:L-aspartate oxidase [Methylorubrum populi]ACB80923.1 L-aspartate oxidase [Methylorubrum populi BJ001]OAH33561.1 L-aspartate oxidase [Methylorubrum populi]PZP73062.1 MAG: L-aspartate oxidase [Methylorubrum populi]
MSVLARSPADRVIVVGAGVAGLATALRLAPRPVTLITAAPLGAGTATGWAQGGIAAAMGADDAPALHAADTRAAGAGLTEPDVALRVAEAGPGLIDWLVALGTGFDREADGALALGLEAAHSRRRIVRARGDSTGRTVLDALVRVVQATPSIEILVAGLHGLMQDAEGRVRGVVCERDGAAFRLPARAVVLATGGVGALYASTTNPRGALGRGLLAAARAGAALRDLEFVQFHPTAIAAGRDPMPLATEALRGEGARLIDEFGDPVMAGIEGGDLAPRDVVARGIFQALSRGRTVYLDTRGSLGARMLQRFPTVAALCAEAGIDPAVQPIPVRPAAHYHMGGIFVDEAGRSTVPGLWACGEVASTGLHGANRLASNSLLEALAFAPRIAESIGDAPTPASADHPVRLPEIRSPDAAALGKVRGIMERGVGVVRDDAGLTQAVAELADLAAQGSDAAATGLMIARAALDRRESRGAHWRSDYPDPRPARHAVVTPAMADAPRALQELTDA